jgi:dihydroorotate dehydrogenase (NAD+) catalytic subunit
MIDIGSGKQSLHLATEVIGASGVFGYSTEYARLLDLSKLGAFVTNPVTLKPRRAAEGTHVVALDSGVLIHTGLPNPGIHKVHQLHASRWKNMPTPIVVHVIAANPEELAQCVQIIDQHYGVDGIEIGIHDEFVHREVRKFMEAARSNTHLPILAQLPLATAGQVALAAEDGGADALVVAASPRGTARDPLTGKFVGGRIYGPWLKPQGLRAVGQIAARAKIPVIGAGGIFNPIDARDYIEAGAKAVQIDAVAWLRPSMVEIICRDLGGLEATRRSGAFDDEWWPGMNETAALRAQLLASPPPVKQPPQLPR